MFEILKDEMSEKHFKSILNYNLFETIKARNIKFGIAVSFET